MTADKNLSGKRRSPNVCHISCCNWDFCDWFQFENQSHVLARFKWFFINEQLPLAADLHSNWNQIYMRINQFVLCKFLLIRQWFMKWHSVMNFSRIFSYDTKLHFPFRFCTHKIYYFCYVHTQLTLINYSWHCEISERKLRWKKIAQIFWDFIFLQLINGRVRCLINKCSLLCLEKHFRLMKEFRGNYIENCKGNYWCFDVKQQGD